MTTAPSFRVRRRGTSETGWARTLNGDTLIRFDCAPHLVVRAHASVVILLLEACATPTTCAWCYPPESGEASSAHDVCAWHKAEIMTEGAAVAALARSYRLRGGSLG